MKHVVIALIIVAAGFIILSIIFPIGHGYVSHQQQNQAASKAASE